MKTLIIEKQMTVDEFIKLLSKGYSGGGDNKNFTITSLGGKELKTPIVVPQKIMSLYNLQCQAKAILEEELKTWK